MDGIHDIGGTDGFGPVDRDDAQFHSEWERYVFGMGMLTVLRGLYNIDQFRHGVERMGNGYYLHSPYHEHWLASMERLVLEHEVVPAGDLEDRVQQFAADEASRYEAGLPEHSDPEFTDFAATLIENGASRRQDPQPPEFETGNDVVVRNSHPPGHTRCPDYVRRATGTVERVHGTFIVPDTHADDSVESESEPVYSVRFTGEELWGPERGSADTVHVDLWERYLRPAEEGVA